MSLVTKADWHYDPLLRAGRLLPEADKLSLGLPRAVPLLLQHLLAG